MDFRQTTEGMPTDEDNEMLVSLPLYGPEGMRIHPSLNSFATEAVAMIERHDTQQSGPLGGSDRSLKEAGRDQLERGRRQLHDAQARANRLAHKGEEQVREAGEKAGLYLDRGRRQVRSGAAKARYQIRSGSVEARRRSANFADEHPLMLGLVGLAAGVLLGASLPRTRQEDRYIGPTRDELIRRGRGQAEALSHEARESAETVTRQARAAVERAARGKDGSRTDD